MSSALDAVLYRTTERLVGYLPNLVAGLVLIAVGWILGWLAKRVVVQLCFVLRFDRLFRRFRWGAAFSKADVRFAFFNAIGNVAFFVVFVVLLKASVDALQLTALSTILERGVLLVPKLAIASAIAAAGWLVAGWVGLSMQRTLVREVVPRATLIARFAKAVVILFFCAMALTELDISREIVIIGFTVTMVTLGALAVVLAVVGGKAFVTTILKHPDDE
jgi:hypothetical protein